MLRVHAIEGNRQRLDGGALFGNAPRALWSRWLQPDSAGTVQVSTRCLLVEDGERRILLEAGIGVFFEPAMRERFGVDQERHMLLDGLAAHGVQDSEIDAVVLSHLHFDHAGGLLSAYVEGASPHLLFPRARYLVGRTALERARHPHPRDRASFVPGLVELLERSGRLEIVEGAASSWLGEPYALRESQGHTPGMLHTLVQGKRSAVFYCADLVPGTHWVHLPISTGFDRSAESVVDEKRALYESLEGTTTWLFFTHDPEVAAARIERDERGRWQPIETCADFASGLDLDA